LWAGRDVGAGPRGSVRIGRLRLGAWWRRGPFSPAALPDSGLPPGDPRDDLEVPGRTLFGGRLRSLTPTARRLSGADSRMPNNRSIPMRNPWLLAAVAVLSSPAIDAQFEPQLPVSSEP